MRRSLNPFLFLGVLASWRFKFLHCGFGATPQPRVLCETSASSALRPFFFFAYRSDCTAERTRLKTLSHSRGLGWRKRRSVGYQGVSSRLRSQRQSGV